MTVVRPRHSILLAATIFTLVLAAFLSFGIPSAAGSSHAVDYTGCIGLRSGSIGSLQEGIEPLRPCNEGQVQFSFSTGGISDVEPRNGLTGGAIVGGVWLGIAPSFQLPQSCGDGQIVRNSSGTWVCGNDANTTYDGSNFAVADQGCEVGSVIVGIGVDGLIDCGEDADTTYNGSDFAVSDQGCDIGNVVVGIGSDGSIVCDAVESSDDGFDPQSCERNEIAKWNDIQEQFQCADISESVGGSLAFDLDGNFDVPDGINRLLVEMWGAGGGGGNGGARAALAGGGGGGGAGGYSSIVVDVASGETLLVDIGDGGTSGSAGLLTSVHRGSDQIVSADGGESGSNGSGGCTGICSGGHGGSGGAGLSFSGHNGARGQSGYYDYSGTFPSPRTGRGGNGGEARSEGTITPDASKGGKGANGTAFLSTPPSGLPGQSGYVLFTW